MKLREAIDLFFKGASAMTGLSLEAGDFYERHRATTPELNPRTIMIERSGSALGYVVACSMTLPVTGEMRLYADTFRMWMATDVLSDRDDDELKALDDEAILALPVETNDTGGFDIVTGLEYFLDGEAARISVPSKFMTVLPDGRLQRR